MNAATKKAMIIAGIPLGLVYLVLLSYAVGGYGYSNYNGVGSRSSIWYFGEPETYHERSNRAGSPGGANLMGGGPESGK